MPERALLMPPARLCIVATAANATRDTTRAYSAMSCACSWVSTHFRNDQKRLCLSCTRPPFDSVVSEFRVKECRTPSKERRTTQNWVNPTASSKLNYASIEPE